MKWFLILLILVSYKAQAGNGSACSVQSKSQSNFSAISAKICEDTKNSAQCRQLYEKIKADGGDAQEKALQCDSNKNALANFTQVAVTGCLIDGVFEATFGAIGRSIGEFLAERDLQSEKNKDRLAECNKSLKHKKNIFEIYNQSVPQILKIAPPTENELKSKPCEKLEAELRTKKRDLERRASFKYTYNSFQKSEVSDPQGREYLEWRKKQDQKLNPLRLPSESDQGLLDLAYEKLGELGVRLECYNSKAAAALMCQTLFTVASGYGALRPVAFKALAGFNQTSKVQKPTAAAAPAMKTEELVSPEKFDKFADGLTQDQYGKMIRGAGPENDSLAKTYVNDGLNRAPIPETISTKNTVIWKSEPNPLRLLTPGQYYHLPEGTVLETINGKKLIKGADYIDNDTRQGVMAVGFRENDILASEKYVGKVTPDVATELKIINEKKVEIKSLESKLTSLNAKKELEQLDVANSQFAAQRNRMKLEEYVKNENFKEVDFSKHLFNHPDLSKQLLGNRAVLRYQDKDSKRTFEIQGRITKTYPAGLEIKDANGVLHIIDHNPGGLKKLFIKESADLPSPVRSSNSVGLYKTNQEIQKIEGQLETARKAENEAREVLYSGSTLTKFQTADHKKVFFYASKKMREQDIVVHPTKDIAIQKNIEINKNLGREPVRIDSNGIPIYAPGTSYFRAMVVKPGDEAIAKKIMTEDGWKSGFNRGVKIKDEDLGKAGNGATRLSDKAPLTDSVVEFVGPKANLGPGFENGFAFPRDSRVVGTGSSTAVIDVAIRTSGKVPKGSFLMVTEIVPRNRELINSQKLFEARKIDSKYPLTYQDGGVEHAVSGTQADEIVNVIFIPIEK